MTTKIAVDSEAQKYWEDYFKDTGYGALWVRDISKRVKAVLDPRRVASNEPVRVVAIDHVIQDDRVILEGLYSSSTGRKAFRIDFKHDGSIISVDQTQVG